MIDGRTSRGRRARASACAAFAVVLISTEGASAADRQAPVSSRGFVRDGPVLELRARRAWLARDLSVAAAEKALAAIEQAASSTERASLYVLAAEAAHWLALMQGEAGQPAEVRQRTYLRGVEHALKAQSLDEDEAGGYFWEAANDARAAEIAGVATSVWKLPRLIWLASRTDELAPGFWWGGTDRARAVLILAVPDWLLRAHAVSLDDAQRYLTRSLGYAPDVLHSRLYLADVVARRGDRDGAAALLEEIVAASPARDPALRPWNELARLEARRQLVELKSSGIVPVAAKAR